MFKLMYLALEYQSWKALAQGCFKCFNCFVLCSTDIKLFITTNMDSRFEGKEKRIWQNAAFIKLKIGHSDSNSSYYLEF